MTGKVTIESSDIRFVDTDLSTDKVLTQHDLEAIQQLPLEDFKVWVQQLHRLLSHPMIVVDPAGGPTAGGQAQAEEEPLPESTEGTPPYFIPEHEKYLAQEPERLRGATPTMIIPDEIGFSGLDGSDMDGEHGSYYTSPESASWSIAAGLRSQDPYANIAAKAEIIEGVLAKINTYGLPQQAYAIQMARMLSTALGEEVSQAQADVMVLNYTGNTIHSHWENLQNAPK